MGALETRIPPPVLTVALGLLMWGFAAGAVMPLAVRWAGGAAAFALAAGFGGTAVRGFRRAGTTIDPVRIERASALVIEGPYRLSRNPMYLSLALMLTVWAFALGPWTALAGPVAFVGWITRFQIRPEERMLQARFGTAYADYARQVRRWV